MAAQESASGLRPRSDMGTSNRFTVSVPLQPIGWPDVVWCLRRSANYWRFFFELLRLRVLFLALFFFAPFFRGTFAPFLRASDSPIAMACLRLFTLPPLPPLPLFNVPFFRRCIALFTRLLAALPYFLPPDFFLAAMTGPV